MDFAKLVLAGKQRVHELIDLGLLVLPSFTELPEEEKQRAYESFAKQLKAADPTYRTLSHEAEKLIMNRQLIQERATMSMIQEYLAQRSAAWMKLQGKRFIG